MKLIVGTLLKLKIVLHEEQSGGVPENSCS